MEAGKIPTAFPGQFCQPRVCPVCGGESIIILDGSGENLTCPNCDGSSVDPRTPFKRKRKDRQ